MSRAKIDRVAPPFELPASTGGTIASWDFKGRQPLVLFFSHANCGPCRSLLERLASELPLYEEHQAQVLALAPTSLAACQRLCGELSLPFPLLADVGGVVRGRFGIAEDAVALIVLDRYGEPYGEWQAEEATALPPAEALLSALRLAELECPECGVPDWS